MGILDEAKKLGGKVISPILPGGGDFLNDLFTGPDYSGEMATLSGNTALAIAEQRAAREAAEELLREQTGIARGDIGSASYLAGMSLLGGTPNALPSQFGRVGYDDRGYNELSREEQSRIQDLFNQGGSYDDARNITVRPNEFGGGLMSAFTGPPMRTQPQYTRPSVDELWASTSGTVEERQQQMERLMAEQDQFARDLDTASQTSGIGFSGAQQQLGTGFENALRAQGFGDQDIQDILAQSQAAETSALLPRLEGAIESGRTGFEAAGDIIGLGQSGARSALGSADERAARSLSSTRPQDIIGERMQQGRDIMSQGELSAQDILGSGVGTGRGDITSTTQAALAAGDPALQSGLRGISAFEQSALDPNSALMQRRLGEAQEALDRSLSARGLFRSTTGAEQQRKLVENITAEEAQRQVGLQQALANMGLGQIGTQQGLLAGSGQQLANLAAQQGLTGSQYAQQRGLTAGQMAGQEGLNIGQLQQQKDLEMAGLAERMGLAQGGLSERTAGNLANIATQQGLFQAQGLEGLGAAEADLIGRYGAAQAGRAGETAANLANLYQAQGASLGGLAERTGTNLANLQQQGGIAQANAAIGQGTQGANLITQTGQGIAGLQSELGTNLANIGMGQSQAKRDTKYGLLSGLIGGGSKIAAGMG